MTQIKRENGYALAPKALGRWIALTLLASVILWLVLFFANLPQVETWQLWARYTARLSFFLFLAVYLASPLYELVQNKATHWLRVNRRNAGISFGIAHIIHLVALVLFLILIFWKPLPLCWDTIRGKNSQLFLMIRSLIWSLIL